MTLVRYSLREARRRPSRLLLTLLGIMIGVGGVVAISTTISATRGAYRQMFAGLTGRAALEVVPVGREGLPASELARLAGFEGVAAAVLVIQAQGALVGPAQTAPVMVLGVDAKVDAAARDYEFASGRQAEAKGEIVLTTSLATLCRAKVGDAVRLWTQQGLAELTVVGIVHPRGAAVFQGGSMAIVPLATAQTLFQLPGQVNSIQLVLDDESAVEEVRRRIERDLPDGMAVQVPASRGALSSDSLIATEQGLGTMSVVSIVAGAFVIVNSVSMSLGERRKQLAILRALGATRRQTTTMLLCEAAALGVLGTILGWIGGYLGAPLLEASMEQLLRIDVPGFGFTWQSLAWAALLGPGVTLAATLVPARRAAGRAPLLDLLDLHDPVAERAGPRSAWAAAALLGVTAAFVFLLTTDRLPRWLAPSVGAPLMASFLVGVMLLAPLAYPGLSYVVRRLLLPWTGLTGRLAVRQLDRHRRRSGLTVGVLLVAVVVTIGMGQTLRNIVHDIRDWARRSITADYLLRAAMPDMATMLAASLPEAMRGELEALPGVARVEAINFVNVKVEGRPALLIARDYSSGDEFDVDVAQGDPETLRRGLLSGQVVLGAALARRIDRRLGDEIELATRFGPLRLRVVGTATDYTVGGSTVLMDRATAQRLLGFEGAQCFVIRCDPNERSTAGEAISRFANQRGLLLQSQADFQAVVDRLMGGVVGFLWLLMALVFVTASLGIVNTLSMCILEQTREFGVLRSVALLRRQVRRIVLCQALALGLMGALPGLAFGGILAYLVNLSARPLTGQPVALTIEPAFMLGCAALAVAIALAAGLIPARRAAALPIVKALQYE